jgi:hypothetical protein
MVMACVTIIQVHLNLVKYRNDDVIKWDVTGYYSYLPAMFIDKDVRLSFITPQNKSAYAGTRYSYIDDQQGNHVLKYPMGMSVLYAPFFFAAHLLAGPLGYPQDGFSEIYEMCIEFSGLFYLLFGLWFLRKFLLRYYNERIVALCLLLLFFGTNLLYYSTAEAPMSHAYTFSLFSAFLFFLDEFYKHVNLKSILGMSISFGLIVLVRPLNVFLILPVFLYGLGSLQDLKHRLYFFTQHFKCVLVFVSIVLVILLPQFLYYRYVTGNFFVFSYGKEQFFLNQFHVHEFLVGFRKGWLIYTPIMGFALYGIWCMKDLPVSNYRSSVLFLVLLYIYLLSSWWCWWYGGSFGQRSMIDLYPLLALPLAAFLSKISNHQKTAKLPVYLVLAFFLLLNIFQTVQYKYNIIDYDGMTAREYVQVFGTLNPAKIDTTLLDKPDYEKAVKGLPE